MKPTTPTRRQFTTGALAAGTFGAAAMAASSLPSTASVAFGTANASTPNSTPHWLSMLGTSQQDQPLTGLRIEGKLPQGLSGTLYRNGPGLFERDDYRKASVLDGDGYVQALSISGGKATHQARFVRTEKYDDEEKVGKYLGATWTTRAPGGMFSNLGGGGIRDQAGVTTYQVRDTLYAIDESTATLHELDPSTLHTKTIHPAGVVEGMTIKAHTKIDAQTGDWIMVGGNYGPSMSIASAVHHKDGTRTALPATKAPRQVYTHDFFATKNYFLVYLQPAFVNPLSFLAGLNSFTQSIKWKPEEGGLLALIPRNGDEARYIETPSSWMWHALNAYEEGNTLIADFVGYDSPEHFIGEDPAFSAIMEGRLVANQTGGHLRRFVVNLDTNTAREERIAEGPFEFPMGHAATALHKHRYGYMSYGAHDSIFHSGLARVDTQTGNTTTVDLGEKIWVGEPIHAPDPAHPLQEDAGWIIAQALDGTTNKSFYAVFNADNLAAGPIARLHLNTHMPISFHGHWTPHT
ncbi:MAG: carotenoid oxygenase family protein [Parvibaculaceae bacterium]|nr:carotenoid oxygenase family protein [Parvibaculaceae bacterium]